MRFGNSTKSNNFSFNTTVFCSDLNRYFDSRFYLYSTEPCALYIIIMLYVLVAIWGAVGNALVIAAVARCQQMRTMRNYFICVLAVSDFFMCTITLPFTMKLILFSYWDLGKYMCKIVSSAQTVNVFVSTMAMASISADRFVVIVFPTRFKAQKVVIIVSCIVMAAIALAMTAPSYLSNGIDKAWKDAPDEYYLAIENECKLQDRWVCHEISPIWSKLADKIYTTFCFLFQYLLPLASLIILNLKITRRLDRRPTSMRSVRSASSHADSIRSEKPEYNRSRSARLSRRLSRGITSTSLSLKHALTLDASDQPEVVRKTIRIKRIMFSVVLTFALCWLPLNVSTALVAFNWINYKAKIHCWCHLVAMLSACSNPIIYGALNENFRNQFKDIVNHFRPSCSRQPLTSNGQQPHYSEKQVRIAKTPARRLNRSSTADACIGTDRGLVETKLMEDGDTVYL